MTKPPNPNRRALPSQSLAIRDLDVLLRRITDPTLCPRCGTRQHPPLLDVICHDYATPQRVIC